MSFAIWIQTASRTSGEQDLPRADNPAKQGEGLWITQSVSFGKVLYRVVGFSINWKI
jgi:hypothetical protein